MHMGTVPPDHRLTRRLWKCASAGHPEDTQRVPWSDSWKPPCSAGAQTGWGLGPCICVILPQGTHARGPAVISLFISTM